MRLIISTCDADMLDRRKCALMTGSLTKYTASFCSALGGMFHSLIYKSYRTFFMGQCVSLTGTWMQRAAEIWLVYSLTKSPLLVGLFGMVQFLPMLVLSLFVGVLIDRFPQKNILIFTQLLFMVQAAAMTVLTLTHTVHYWELLVLALIFGISQAIDLPVRQAYFYCMVGQKEIMNAVSLNSAITNLAKVTGPALAGIVLLALSPGYCFLLNTLSFAVVLFSIFSIPERGMPTPTTRGEKESIWSDVREGLRYIANNETLRLNSFVFGIAATFAMNNEVILPILSNTVLHTGVHGYTVLMTATGVGSFAGALSIAFLSKKGVKKPLLILAAFATALLQIITAFTHVFVACLILLVAIGYLNLILIPIANTIYQLYSPNAYRGRVLSIYSLLNQGSTPVGNFLTGTFMEVGGSSAGFFFCGASTLALLTVALFSQRSIVRKWWSTHDSAS
jgi:MFS family permease